MNPLVATRSRDARCNSARLPREASENLPPSEPIRRHQAATSPAAGRPGSLLSSRAIERLSPGLFPRCIFSRNIRPGAALRFSCRIDQVPLHQFRRGIPARPRCGARIYARKRNHRSDHKRAACCLDAALGLCGKCRHGRNRNRPGHIAGMTEDWNPAWARPSGIGATGCPFK
jgi:hypothetical protein